MTGSSCHHINQAESDRIRNMLTSFFNVTTVSSSPPQTFEVQPEHEYITKSYEVKDFRKYSHISNIQTTQMTAYMYVTDSYFENYVKVRAFVIVVVIILAYLFLTGVFLKKNRKSEKWNRKVTGDTAKYKSGPVKLSYNSMMVEYINRQ